MTRAVVIDAIARVCHEITRAYCESSGDYSQLSWDRTPLATRQSVTRGVTFVLNNTDTTPTSLHGAWCADQEAHGWTYAAEKNEAVRVHPDLVPYVELPHEQKVKYHLFLATVRVLWRG